MKTFFPSLLRKALPILCLLLSGCDPNSNLASNEPLLPSAHNASYSGASAIPPTPDRRSHPRPSRALQSSRNAPPQGPVPIN